MFQSDLKHDNKPLAQKLEALYALNRGTRLDLGFRAPYLNLLHKFGDPHLSCPPTIHVAGTNGKGSTIAMMRAILEESGYSVHTYTSPHLIQFNERITLSGAQITDTYLETLIDQALEHNAGNEISFFEITTAIAFKAFADTPADILLLETGLGGRLDCTNVIESPLLTILTSISMDHEEFLGDTPAKIAAEKAGIMKENTPCIISYQTDKDVQITLKKHAADNQINTITAGADWTIDPNQDPNSETFTLRFKDESYRCKTPSLKGLHQIQNAAVAIASLRTIAAQFSVHHDTINQGLQKTRWSARMQNITPHVQGANINHHEIWLDGGHNKAAAHTLLQHIKTWNETDPKPLHIIIGMMGHKDSNAFIDTLKPHTPTMHFTHIPGETDNQNTMTPTESWDTITKTILTTHKDARIIICGSLYLAGHVLQTIGLQA